MTTKWMRAALTRLTGNAPKARGLIGERRGNVAILFALAIVPMLGALGLAVDYSRFMALRSTAQTAADSSALFAAKVIKDGLSAAKGSSAAEAPVLADAKKRADAMFVSYVKSATMGKIIGETVVNRNGTKIAATVNYALTLPTTIGSLLGLDRLVGSSSSETIAGLPLFIDINLVLDNSQSMGIAATAEAMAELYTKTAPNNCVFGCHVAEGGNKSNETIAADNNIKLRIDVLRQASKDMIKQAQDDMAQGGFYRFALYTVNNNLVTLASMTENLSYAYKQADKIALGNPPPGNLGDTNLNGNLPKLLGSVKANADGLSQGTAKSYVFIVSDGSNDVYGQSCTWGHCMSVVDPKICKSYKDKGAIVGVIYTTYLPIPENPLDPTNLNLENAYKTLVLPIAPAINPALKACASEGWFFEADDDKSIHAAMSKLFKQINTPPTLTN